jgi:hypothetical protein
MAKNKYSKIIEAIFFKHYEEGDEKVPFQREEIERVSIELEIKPPKNFGDLLYSFRFRDPLPDSIREKAPENMDWIIKLVGRSSYLFQLTTMAKIKPNNQLVHTKILDSTPGLIDQYAMSDEQALLAKIRYNRMIDIFTGITCYSLQNHLRTTVSKMGQVETDEIYVGVDKKGIQYILPVQAKGGDDKLGIVQIEQDFTVCKSKFPNLEARAIAAQFMANDIIALFEFEESGDEIGILEERHYKLVNPDALSEEELNKYRSRSE